MYFHSADIRSMCVTCAQDNLNLFFESCLRLVEVYVKHNTNRLTDEVNAEEDSFSDLQIFIELLDNLFRSGIFSRFENGNDPMT